MACVAARTIGRAVARVRYDLAAESLLGAAGSLGGLGNRIGCLRRRFGNGVLRCGTAPARSGRLGPAARARRQPCSECHPRPARRASPGTALGGGVGGGVGGRAARSAEAAGHRGRTADAGASTSAERFVIARPGTNNDLAIPSAHGQRPSLHHGAGYPDVPARGALVPGLAAAVRRPLCAGRRAPAATRRTRGTAAPGAVGVRPGAGPPGRCLLRPAATSGRAR